MAFAESVLKGHKRAVEVLENSYSPYSKLRVSCALFIKEMNDFMVGVNVENASFGATLCAERAAMVATCSRLGTFSIEFAVIISDFKGEPIPPCGMCLQVFSEFAGGHLPIYLGNQKELIKEYQLKDFLPLAFSQQMLP